MSEQNQSGETNASKNETGVIDTIISLLGSLKFSLGIVGIIAIACIAGTVIPQGEKVEEFVANNPGSHQGLDMMVSLGLTNVFYSTWFAILLCVFSCSLIVCTGRRFRMIRRSTGAVKVRVTGSFITHVSLLLVLFGGVIRIVWGEKGVLPLSEGQTAAACAGPGGEVMPLPFSIRLLKFEIEHYKQAQGVGEEGDQLLVQWEEKGVLLNFPVELKKTNVVAPGNEKAEPDNSYRVTVEQYLPDFYMDSTTGEAKNRSDEPNNPAVYVSIIGGGSTNSQWVFARFPEFTRHSNNGNKSGMPLQFQFLSRKRMMVEDSRMVKTYRSTVEVLEQDKVVLKKAIEVNLPLSYRGYTFYQMSYTPEGSVLQVVRDPGVPVVYSGFVLMMVGLTVVFCVGPYLDDKRKGLGKSV